jgi:hypothetical protein
LAAVGSSPSSAGENISSPVPAWKPSFQQSLPKIVDRIAYYYDDQCDFSIFRNGACVILPDGSSDEAAKSSSLKVLSDIITYHPDMDPKPMDDGNILIGYNQPAVTVVLQDVAKAHWDEIERRHLDGLVKDEVLITPLGPNKFDNFGKQALLGRAWMFMDAEAPEIVMIKRKGKPT